MGNGSGNTVRLEYPLTFKNSKIQFYSNGNSIDIKKSDHLILKACFSFRKDGHKKKILIGENFSSNECKINMLEEKSILKIGSDCMFGYDIKIRNSDGHVILDKAHRVINKAENIEIGNHVWVGFGARILKNVKIPDNTIVGASAIVTKKFHEKNTAIAGNPARVVKKNIYWQRDMLDDYIEKRKKAGV
ncbi:MAG: acyltransferase [Lactobacillales bacterium]|nr:acyltransferase [Lactobacillales bacterium]